jgi:phthiocerol/phenolphthiocerol synthesis type-I polyketide synthase E
MTDATSTQSDALAVVGMAVRAPMSPDLDRFWANIVAGRSCLTRLDGGDGAGWVPVKGVLDGAEDFDAELFGFSPREAEITDPQQRILLELAWHALEDAGHTPRSCGRVGVFASATQSRYARLLEEVDPKLPDTVGELTLRIATESDFLATRVAYRLDLTGPALTVQSACSSSLVAVHVAAGALLAGDCDTALVGGVTVTLPVRAGYRYVPGSILSPDGQCRAFDASAQGTVPGNGGAVVVLRRLDDALASGDDIYALVLGSAINNDGQGKIGFTAPSGAGQSAAIRAAHRVAGVSPSEIGFVEAHGTGTPLGDSVEIGALHDVFGPARPDGTWCGISSTKSNIGHLDAAAGIVSFVKTVLAVRDGVVPATVGFRQPNPALELDRGPFRVFAETAPWPRPGLRIASVSSFGVGGTNAHVIVAQAPERTAPRSTAATLELSARTPAALAELAEALAAHLERHPTLDLDAVAYTLAHGRVPQPCRRVVHGERAELIAALRAGRSTSSSSGASSSGASSSGASSSGASSSAASSTGAPAPALARRVHLPGTPFERRRFWPDRAPQVDALDLPELFASVLGRRPERDSDNFFDLGGDSLMAIQLMSRITDVIGVELELDAFFDTPTIAGLAAQLAQAQRR